MTTHTRPTRPEPLVEDWWIARKLFSEPNTVSGLIWLLVRVLLGWNWLHSGIDKFQDYGPWRSGAAVTGFAKGALGNMTGAHPSVIEGYFGLNKAWLTFVANSGGKYIGPVIPFVECTIGGCLILGLFTGILATVGLLMNTTFLFGGNAGVNPPYALAEILLIMAWRNAGSFGLDRMVLPKVGTPWASSRKLP